MGLFDMFTKSTTATQPQLAPQNPNVNPALAPAPAPQGSQDINPTVPNNNNLPLKVDATTDSGVAKSPLDNFKDIWQTVPINDNSAPFTFNADPAKIALAAKSLDFSKVIPVETMTAISKGGTEAATAFAQAMNLVTQAAYAQSAQVSTKLAETAVAEMQKKILAQLPNLVKQQQVNDALRTNNPLFENPAVAPIMEALQMQLTAKNPTATADQIREHAEAYLTGLVQTIMPGATVPAAPKSSNRDMDWSKFIQ